MSTLISEPCYDTSVGGLHLNSWVWLSVTFAGLQI